MHVYLNGHVDVSMLTTVCFCTFTVKRQWIIWSFVSLSCWSSLSLWCHWAAELVSKLQRMNRKSACYLQNVWEYQNSVYLSVHETRHTPLPVSTALNEHVSARTTTLWLLLNEYPLVCVSGECFFFTDARLLSVSICVWVFPWRVLCVRLPSIHQPYDNRSTLPIPSLTNHCHSQMMDISCKGRTFTAGLSKLKATSTFIERLSISCFVLLFDGYFRRGLRWKWYLLVKTVEREWKTLAWLCFSFLKCMATREEIVCKRKCHFNGKTFFWKFIVVYLIWAVHGSPRTCTTGQRHLETLDWGSHDLETDHSKVKSHH